MLATDEYECVGYRLHDMRLVPTSAEDELVGHLGPDVLGPDWDHDEALRRLRAHPDEQIGVALLDQRNLAGIGNLYKVESLFLTGVNPWARVADVPDLAGLVTRARTLMLANRDRPAQSTTGETRRGQDHWVAGRRAARAAAAGTAILLGDQGARPAGAGHLVVPSCQATPTPVDPRARTGAAGHRGTPRRSADDRAGRHDQAPTGIMAGCPRETQSGWPPSG